MAANKLILYPSQADCPAIDIDELALRLESIGLIGTAFQCQGGTRYLAGERFLQLVTLLGCSPQIELEPPADAAAAESACAEGRFCHVRLVANRNVICFRASAQAPPPRCPHCRQVEARWPDLLQRWETNPDHPQWTCAECGHQGRLYDLNLRRSGGFAHTYIEIWGIFPSEAVPGETLLSTLQQLGDCDWNYMFVSD
jgi:Zn ribbon nucleic-acid-binding protein